LVLQHEVRTADSGDEAPLLGVTVAEAGRRAIVERNERCRKFEPFGVRGYRSEPLGEFHSLTLHFITPPEELFGIDLVCDPEVREPGTLPCNDLKRLRDGYAVLLGRFRAALVVTLELAKDAAFDSFRDRKLLDVDARLPAPIVDTSKTLL